MTRPVSRDETVSLARALHRQLCDANLVEASDVETRRNIDRHVATLVRAAQSGAPELFAHYVAWTRQTLPWLGREAAELDAFLAAARDSGELRALGLGGGLDHADGAEPIVAPELAFSPDNPTAAPVACAACVYYARHPEYSVWDGIDGQRALVRRLRTHHRQLTAAIDADNGELFVEYALFAALFLRWSGVHQAQFLETLDALEASLERHGAPGTAAAAQDLVARARDAVLSRPVAPTSIHPVVPRSSMAADDQPPPAALEARLVELAQVVVCVYYMRHPAASLADGEPGRQTCFDDTLEHLKRTASAMASDSPRLLAEHFAWSRDVLDAAAVPEEVFRNYTIALVDGLRAAFPSGQGEVIADFVERALEELGEARSITSSRAIDESTDLGRLARRFLEHLLAGERSEAGRLIIDTVEAGTSIEDVYLGIFQASQHEVGRLWQLNKLSVAQEHYCTAATQMIMSQLYPYLFRSERNGKVLVATCITQDLHEIGIRMVCDLYEMAGWDTYYLGANTPTSAVIESVVERNATVLAVSATLGTNVRRVEDLIRAMRADERCAETRVIVGGLPFLLDTSLWQRFGADGTAKNAREAVALGARLTGSP